MCLQDVKLGRRKHVDLVTNGQTATNDGATFGKNNPNRAAYIITGTFLGITNAGHQLYIRPNSAPTATLAVLNMYNPRVVLDVETYGQAVFGELFILDGGNFGIDYSIAEVVWDDDLDRLVSSWG